MKIFRENINRLWVRLSMAFALVVLIGVMLTSFIGILVSTPTQFNYVNVLRDSEGPVAQLAAYYQTNQWDNAAAFMQGVQSAYGNPDYFSLSFSLIDYNGALIFDTHPTNTEQYPYVQFDETLPVTIGGNLQGYLRGLGLASDKFLRDYSPQSQFLAWLEERIWWMSLMGALIGIIFGGIFARNIAAPLRNLAEAANHIARRDLKQRVALRGTTEMVLVGSAFNNMAEELAHAEKLRRNLVADVAHELRTPLTVLQGNLRAMLDGVYPTSAEEIANLYDQTRVLSRLVNDLHELAQADANQLPMNLAIMNVGDVVTRLVATFSAIAEAEGVSIQTYIAPDLPLINGDSGRIAQVVNNLLNNALHHTASGGVIHLKLALEEERLCLEVTDTGKGISDDHLPHVFERFYRADRARSRNSGGAGLGLAIVKAIVTAHHGEIIASSDGEGHGATFKVWLPSIAT
jgi:two-component system OmpR family sensor kinase/two-component system sensor histidine kinase BaeS